MAHGGQNQCDFPPLPSSNPSNPNLGSQHGANPNVCTPMNRSITSYAKAASSDVFPNKDQAICFNLIKGTNEKDYITAVGNIIQPVNIRVVSRMSRDRCALFLSDKKYVDLLVENHSTLHIDNKPVSIRRLVNPNKRFIISNICPSIPHDFIENILINQYNVKLESSISFLKYGMKNITGYSHLLNSKREFYITPDLADKIPDTILLMFEETNYRIFITPDTVKCFICNDLGHISKNCPNSTETPNLGATEETPHQVPETIITGTTNPVSADLHQDSSRGSEISILTQPPIITTVEQTIFSSNTAHTTVDSVKRPLSVSSIGSSVSRVNENPPPKPKNRRKKKRKNASDSEVGKSDSYSADEDEETMITEDSVLSDDITLNKDDQAGIESESSSASLKKILMPLQENIAKFANSYPLSAKNFELFIDMVKDNKTAVQVALHFTNDLKGLLKMLRDNKGLIDIKHRSTKIKFKKIMDKLEEELLSNATLPNQS